MVLYRTMPTRQNRTAAYSVWQEGGFYHCTRRRKVSARACLEGLSARDQEHQAGEVRMGRDARTAYALSAFHPINRLSPTPGLIQVGHPGVSPDAVPFAVVRGLTVAIGRTSGYAGATGALKPHPKIHRRQWPNERRQSCFSWIACLTIRAEANREVRP